jgi:acetyl-CoA carboxylase biotin carboxyl carrier protein
MAHEEIHAELAATVLRLQSPSGSRVDDGDVLLLLESMKMEIPVVAEGPGTVVRYAVAPGSAVRAGDLMVVIEQDPPRAG